MWSRDWVLPAKIVYTVEEYRFEAGVVFMMIVITLMAPLLSRLDTAMAASSMDAAFVYTPPEYPIINKQAIPQVSAAPQRHLAVGTEAWPIHGLVTTEFGVPHRPWQKTHTGIDISSRARSGVTDVTVFREGMVIKAGRASGGYGKHVVVDHGGGLTSLYAHLYSISAAEGQPVKPGDSLGKEGSTGASTGTHLHFEIMLDGKPVNPRKYLAGSP